MAAPATINDFLNVVRKSQQVDIARLDAFLRQRENDTLPPDPGKFAALLVRAGVLTSFQAEQFLLGKHKGFLLGGYRIIERLGSGGTGTVYLAEHQVMKRRVALKVLTSTFAEDPAILERFRREAQAAAAVDHPNIVRAYDFREEGQLHFLVLEYVHGPSLQEVIERQGPLPIDVACDYIRQAAIGLEHAHKSGLVHRDVKPANLLIDASGIVKVLDLGLARFAPEGQESVTRQFDENLVMGTADYIAPEQAVSLHHVDSRADIYSLGATFYALLAGEPPFHEGTITQKLLWHQMRAPGPIRDRRPEAPAEVVGLIELMMAKSLEERIQTCAEVAARLDPWCPKGPTAQGPAQLAAGSSPDKPSTYLLANSLGHGTAARGMAPATNEGMTNEADLDRSPESSRARVRIVKDTSAARAMGVALLGAVMLIILLLVGGGVAFLIWGPQPQVTPISTGPDLDDKPLVVKDRLGPWRAGPPGQLADRVGAVLRLVDSQKGSDRVAFATDGRLVATAGNDRAVRIHDILTNGPPTFLGGHTDKVTSVAFPHNGSGQLLSASSDKTVRLWDVGKKTEIKQFPAYGKAILAAVFSPDDKRVLTGGEDGVGRLFEIDTSRLIKELKGHTAPISSLDFRPKGGNQALSGSADKSIRVWNLDNGQMLRQLDGHADRVCSVAYVPDGILAVSGSADGAVRLWNTETGQSVHTFTGHTGAVYGVAVSPNGKQALSAGLDQKIRLWDLKKRQLRHIFSGHTRSVMSVAFARDGKHFASTSEDATVRVWGVPPP